MGKTLSSVFKNDTYNIMLAGLSKSGKTYFLYKHLKNVINSEMNVITSNTYSFNVEKYNTGASKLIIWDMPGDDNLRMFWTIFFKNINFEGVIYIINYDENETLDEGNINISINKFINKINEAVIELHELLTSYETKFYKVLILINSKCLEIYQTKLRKIISMKNKFNNNTEIILENNQNYNDKSNSLIKQECEIEDKINDIIKKIKKDINFNRLPQVIKNIEVFNIYNNKESFEELDKLRNIIIRFVKDFV